MSNLEPCPFCGGKAIVVHGDTDTMPPDLRKASVKCVECGCGTPVLWQSVSGTWRDVDAMVIEMWNKRAGGGTQT